MARLTIEASRKRYGEFRALDDVSLDVDDGEFVAILGASGCGKTTLLRQIAGFDRPDAGRILIGDSVVSTPARQLPPEQRHIGIVFQSYALWPHMTVARERRVRARRRRRQGSRARASRRRGACARRPGRDSATGAPHCCRAASASAWHSRAASSPSRRWCCSTSRSPISTCICAQSMEEEFARFHERTGTTMIYITHDQAEAMALADRIAVMDKGRILQLATPSQLYREPADETVARFIGEGMIVPIDNAVADGERPLHRRRARASRKAAPRRAAHRRRVSRAPACVRARCGQSMPPRSGVNARVTAVIYQGGHFRVEALADAAPDVPLHLDVREPASIRAGDRVNLAIDDGWVLPVVRPTMTEW